MGSIIQLPDDVITKIAAGEVIERPAYVVKELIENAIDAGADYIRIDIEDSGFKKIAVTDNGKGMDRDDVLLSYTHHATSKLQSADQLHEIRSLGFRGEALSSIAAVSSMRIMSRPHMAPLGTMVDVIHGKKERVTTAGMAYGTIITVEHVFQDIPARQKFFKSKAAEFRHIVQVITQFGLAYPEIRFFATHQKKVIIDLPSTAIQQSRFSELLGNSLVHELIPISSDKDHIQVTGFIARPQRSSKIPNSYLYVNSRAVHDRHITSVVKQAFGTLLDPRSYPIFILYVKVPVDLVDVNVHPRKEEVRFRDQISVHATIREAVISSLAHNNLTFHDARWQRKEYGTSVAEANAQTTVRRGATDSVAAQLITESPDWSLVSNTQETTYPIMQIHNLYIVTSSAKGLVIIDQHAAHERILYEQYLHTRESLKGTIKPTALTKPSLIHLSATDSLLLDEHADIFSQMGFEIRSMGRNTYGIYAVPYVLVDRELNEVITGFLDDLRDSGTADDMDIRSQRMIAYLACRNAVKAGDTLTQKQCRELIKKLSETPNNYTCPHGRPTRYDVSLAEFAKLFRR